MNERMPGRIALLVALAAAMALGPMAGADEPDPRYPFGAETKGLMSDLEWASLRDELKITPDQLAALKRQAVVVQEKSSGDYARAQYANRRALLFGYTRPEDQFIPTESGAWLAWEGRANAAVKAILTDSQWRRLMQIDTQRTFDLYRMLDFVLGKQALSPSTARRHRELYELWVAAKRCAESERILAPRGLLSPAGLDRLVKEKCRQLDAAYYTRLLALFTREQRERWSQAIGEFYRATGAEAGLEPIFGDLYFALLLSQGGTVELPLDPYLVLPGGATTGQEYPGFPRNRAGNR